MDRGFNAACFEYGAIRIEMKPEMTPHPGRVLVTATDVQAVLAWNGVEAIPDRGTNEGWRQLPRDEKNHFERWIYEFRGEYGGYKGRAIFLDAVTAALHGTLKADSRKWILAQRRELSFTDEQLFIFAYVDEGHWRVALVPVDETKGIIESRLASGGCVFHFKEIYCESASDAKEVFEQCVKTWQAGGYIVDVG